MMVSTYTYKLRDDASVPQRPQDDGRRHHLVVHAHHGRQQGLPRRALRAHHQGAVDVEKGQAKEISGLKKIDDFARDA